ncbi:helix-turn-helix domain-containing protein [Frankia sp. AgKG'84/4]|uniref:helix-turn-helix domain-containing protein n=1 Tax=Frankia sp. AgKG'84/4 TaxID=573490 RepID=UPI00200DAA73|nr:helix-turn-helix transcriptional regulator [Frankia sp. AgKG'84/4]MCL9796569.1 helix-turn-helix transcriptional regulator [Frankia sp. AgKG'84/4]
MGTPLGEFLRARRDATRPEALGLAVGARRRVPGLRRSELASLAGISVEYLIRIEQGSDRNPSPAVVNALAGALRLNVTEREHLRHLTKIGGGVCVGRLAQPRPDVRPAVLTLLDQFEPGIALVTNRLGDLLAFTAGFDLLARPCGLLDGPRPNLTRYVFTDARARAVFPDWGTLADERAFDLWLGPSAERTTGFSAELAAAAGEEFTRRRDQHALPTRGRLRWVHPTVGELRLDREVLELPPSDAQQFVAFLPGDDASADALRRLHVQRGTVT